MKNNPAHLGFFSKFKGNTEKLFGLMKEVRWKKVTDLQKRNNIFCAEF